MPTKRLSRIIILVTAILLAAATAGASGLTPLGSLQWVKEGVRVEGGAVPYALPLAEGGYRLYYCGAGGILSARSADGLTFAAEPDIRLASVTGDEAIVCDPSVVPLPQGGYRMYYKGMNPSYPWVHRVYSAYSTDSLVWQREGLRYQNLGPPDYGFTSVPDVVRLPDGRYRLYYTGGEMKNATLSAISADGLTFTREEGIRLEPAVDPNVLLLPDGTYRMFYSILPSLGNPQAIYTAISDDGLTWSPQGLIVAPGGTYDTLAAMDPGAVLLPQGDFRVYYGGQDDYGNMRTLSARSQSPTPPLTPTATLSPTPAASVVQQVEPIAPQLEIIYSYDTANTQDPWQIYDPRAPAFANDLRQLEPGRGYWIKVNSATTITSRGISVRLSPGWNLVAWAD